MTVSYPVTYPVTLTITYAPGNALLGRKTASGGGGGSHPTYYIYGF